MIQRLRTKALMLLAALLAAAAVSLGPLERPALCLNLVNLGLGGTSSECPVVPRL